MYYTTNSNLPLSQWESQFVDNNKLTTVSDLVPHTIYTIRVEAYTAIGPGPPSPPVQVNNTISLPPLSTLDQIILFCLPSSLVKSEFFFNLDQKTRKIKYQNHFTNIFFISSIKIIQFFFISKTKLLELNLSLTLSKNPDEFVHY